MNGDFHAAALPKVTVFGVGAAGCNAVSGLFARTDMPLHIICANTDAQALAQMPANHRLQLGQTLTAGLGAGARPCVGQAAAEETGPEIISALKGSALCFVAAGMGGGTGTGAAPVIARMARAMGILTVGIATRPFAFEGSRRARVAEEGIAAFRQHVDALIVVCNEHLFRVIGAHTSALNALHQSDAVMCDSVMDLAALVSTDAIKGVTMADLWALLGDAGRTVIGFGQPCSGTDRARRAAESALSNPLLEDSVHGAGRLLATVSGGDDLTLFEVDSIIAWLRTQVDPDADLIWGSSTHSGMTGSVRVGLAATGLPDVVPDPLPDSLPDLVQPTQPVPSAPDMMLIEAAAPTASAQEPIVQAIKQPPASPQPCALPALTPAPVAQAFHDDSASGPLFQYQALKADIALWTEPSSSNPASAAPLASDADTSTPALPVPIVQGKPRAGTMRQQHKRTADSAHSGYHPSLVDRICSAITGRSLPLPPALLNGDGKIVMGPAFNNSAAGTTVRPL